MRDPKRYKTLTDQLTQQVNYHAKKPVADSLTMAGHCAEKAALAKQDGDRAMAIESLVHQFAGGLTDIIDRNRIAPGSRAFDWLAKRYGDIFTSGSEHQAQGYSYYSYPDGADTIALEVIPENPRFGMYLELYEFALSNGLLPYPKKFSLYFADDDFASGTGPCVTRKAVLGIKR
jgi:hypothetical protein